MSASNDLPFQILQRLEDEAMRVDDGRATANFPTSVTGFIQNTQSSSSVGLDFHPPCIWRPRPPSHFIPPLFTHHCLLRGAGTNESCRSAQKVTDGVRDYPEITNCTCKLFNFHQQNDPLPTQRYPTA